MRPRTPKSRYTGFCPDLREHFGQTYGHATRHIMKDKPHLKQRLAPVFYNYRRGVQDRKDNGKCCDREKEKYDQMRAKRTTESVDPCKRKVRMDFEDGDRIRNMGPLYSVEDQEYYSPRFVYIEGILECPPGLLSNLRKEDQYHVHHPFVSMPCAHTRECADTLYPRKDSKRDQRMRIPRVRPYRQGGVIPKYTGHIPGMLFSFGESYGPASDRLLRRHHDYMMKHEKRKS